MTGLVTAERVGFTAGFRTGALTGSEAVVDYVDIIFFGMAGSLLARGL